jgi:Carbohydrate esterase, sialic acid-specific acetylesterase
MSSFPSLAGDKDERLQIFLLIGQSNMAGRGKVEAANQPGDPRILMLSKDLKWLPAKDPVHFDKPIAGAGLCLPFARSVLAAGPEQHIGLVPCAMGGSSLDQWMPGGALYTAAVRRTREALKRGELAGILWHQGEADTAPAKVASYGDRFAKMIASLRKDLEAPEAPVVIGELGHFLATGKDFNKALPAVVKQVPHCALASAEGLADKGDKLHFGTPALTTFGERYAAAYLKMKKAAASPRP